jgi:predicted metal-dependent phosphotriesterase family hydrolase
MEDRGLGADVRRRLLVDNPARVFAFASIDRGISA